MATDVESTCVKGKQDYYNRPAHDHKPSEVMVEFKHFVTSDLNNLNVEREIRPVERVG